MKIAVLCPDRGRLNAARIIEALSEADIPTLLVITTPSGIGLGEKILRIWNEQGLVSVFRRATRFAGNRASRMLKAQKNAFEVAIVPDLNHPACVEVIKRYEVEVGILASTPIIKPHILAAFKWGALNAHNGLLPRYRGTGCLPWSIAHDDPAGASVHLVTPQVDAGPVCLSKEITVEPADTYESLRRKNYLLRIEMLRDALKMLLEGNLHFVEQEPGAGRTFRGREMTPEILEAVNAKVPAYVQNRLELYAKEDYPWISYDTNRPASPTLLMGPPSGLKL